MSKPAEKQVATTLSEGDYEWLASYAQQYARSIAGQLRHMILTEKARDFADNRHRTQWHGHGKTNETEHEE